MENALLQMAGYSEPVSQACNSTVNIPWSLAFSTFDDLEQRLERKKKNLHTKLSKILKQEL